MTPDYPLLARQLEALLDTPDWLTNSAQTCAFLMQELPDLNWVGFYLQRQPEMLSLGPFQGKPACHPIPFTKGVCGAAARTRETQRGCACRGRPYRLRCGLPGRAGGAHRGQ